MTNEDLDEVLEEVDEVVEATEELIEPLAKAGATDEVRDLVERTEALVDSVAELHGAERDGRENSTPTTTAEIPVAGRTNWKKRQAGDESVTNSVEVPERGSGRRTYTEEVPIQSSYVDDPDTVEVERSELDEEAIMNIMLPSWRKPRLQEARRKAQAERKQRRKNQRERRERMARETAGSHYMNMAPEDVDDDLDIPVAGRENWKRRQENDEDA